MKKLRLVMAFIAAGAVINFSSCSKDDDNSTNNTPTTPTVAANGALIDGVAVTKVSDPVMSDKIAVLETTAGKFEMEFASKPTESGTYTVKSALSAKDALTASKAAAGALKEVTFKYTDKGNIIYKATDGSNDTTDDQRLHFIRVNILTKTANSVFVFANTFDDTAPWAAHQLPN